MSSITINQILEDIRSPRVKDVILDTDAANEMDDQFVIPYIVGCDKLNLLSVNAALFGWGSVTTEEGARRCYNEAVRVCRAIRGEGDTPIEVYETSPVPMMSVGGEAVDSPAVQNIIKSAMAAEDILYVLSIGACTNVASAIKLEPRIKDKICVIWLGGNQLEIGVNDLNEFNFIQDTNAGRFLLDSGVPLVLCPARNVTIVLRCFVEEFQRELSGGTPVMELLLQLVNEFHSMANYEEGYSRTMWDIAAPALLSVPDCAEYITIPAPIINEELHYSFDDSRHEIIMLDSLNRDMVFEDCWKCIKAVKCTGEYIPRWTPEEK